MKILRVKVFSKESDSIKALLEYLSKHPSESGLSLREMQRAFGPVDVTLKTVSEPSFPPIKDYLKKAVVRLKRKGA